MSVNIKKNGTLTKLAGLYANINLRLSQLLDTDISSLEDGQILAYNNETGKWENQDAPAGVEVVDNLTTQSATSALSANQGYVLNNALAGKANAADVLPTLITSPANKQILSYDSSSNKWVNTANGNTVLLGTADPAANLGKEGDLYVKLSSSSYGNSYRIHTKSTGGETASIDVDTITDGTVVATQNIRYHWPSQTFPDFSTNYKSSNWTVTITSNNVYGRAQGSTITWPYYQTNDVTLTINPPSVYGIFVKSRGIWIQIGKSPVENFAELKDTNFNNLQDGQLAVYNSTTNKWENQTPDFSDKFIITRTWDEKLEEYTLDKTPSETLTAHQAGKTIILKDVPDEAHEDFYLFSSFYYYDDLWGCNFVRTEFFDDDNKKVVTTRQVRLFVEKEEDDTWSGVQEEEGIEVLLEGLIYLDNNELKCSFSPSQLSYALIDGYYPNIFLKYGVDNTVYTLTSANVHNHVYKFSTIINEGSNFKLRTFTLTAIQSGTSFVWQNIVMSEAVIPTSNSNILTLTISQDEQTGDLVCDKLPSEVQSAYTNGAVIQVKALVGEELTLSLIYVQDMSFFFGATVLSAEAEGIASVGINLLKDSSNDVWESIDFYDEHVTEPKIATISKNGNVYSCDLTPDEIDDAIKYDAGVVLQYTNENNVKFNYTFIGYADVYLFAAIVPTDPTNATIQMFRLDPSGDTEWNSITLLEYNLGSDEFSLEQTATTSTSANTVYTFTDARITVNNVVDVYTNIFGVSPSNVVLANGSCTVTFPAQASAQSMTCKIYVK